MIPAGFAKIPVTTDLGHNAFVDELLLKFDDGFLDMNLQFAQPAIRGTHLEKFLLLWIPQRFDGCCRTCAYARVS